MTVALDFWEKGNRATVRSYAIVTEMSPKGTFLARISPAASNFPTGDGFDPVRPGILGD